MSNSPKIIFIDHPYFAVKNKDNNYRFYKGKDANGKRIYKQCKDKTHYAKEVKQYLFGTNGFFTYSRDEKKANITLTEKNMNLFEYMLGETKDISSMKANNMIREKMMMLSNGKFETDEEAIKKNYLWSKYFDNSNINLMVLSFDKTSTIPAIDYIHNYYSTDCQKLNIGLGAVSTEHSVMCSNYAVDGDEITLLRRLLTEIYPNTSFSAVLDSYDYWNIIDNVLPQLKKEILEHNGCMFMRGDRGDCVEVVTKTAFKLWDIFGGTINSKGYKVLDPHVKAIYGDSITVQRCEEIYKILIENGFACNNVSLGVGSFSMQCIEEDGILKPFTRDTFSSCIKATYCEVDGKPIPIFKNPKEGGFKKSQKGLCFVYRDENGNLTFKDGYTSQDIPKENNLLETVFKDGNIVREQSLADIRKLMYGDKF